MKLSRIGFLVALLCGSALAQTPPPREAEVNVMRVLDGDTFEIAMPGENALGLSLTVRVRGINAPEHRSNCGSTDAQLNTMPQNRREGALAARNRLRNQERQLADRATEEARRLLEGSGNRVVIHNYEHDKYGGRIVASVRLSDGTDFSERMLASGLVMPYSGRGERTWCGRTGPVTAPSGPHPG